MVRATRTSTLHEQYRQTHRSEIVPVDRPKGYSGRVATLEEIGVKFGISKERVRQIEITAMRKLKAALMNDADVRDLLEQSGIRI